MDMNEKLFKLLTDFADCYDANLIPVVPTNSNLNYIVFKNAEVRDAILPFIKEPFYKEHDDDLIFKKTSTESWESIATIKSILTDKINRLTAIENEINKSKENTYTNEELNFIISIRYERTIDNASSIKYNNNYYLPVSQNTGEIVSFKCGTKCTVVNTYDQKILGIINGEKFLLTIVEQQNNTQTKASKNGFKPSDDNPWKKFKIK